MAYILLQIVCGVCQWKNCENQSIVGEDIDKNKVPRFCGQRCRSVLTGFQQVRENWKKSGILCGQGKSRKGQKKNIIFKKSGKMILDHADCRYLWFFCVSKYSKAGKFAVSIKRPKARSVSASVGRSFPLTLRPGPLSFAYCSFNTVSLLYDIVYHFWNLCDRPRVIVSTRLGKLSFRDWNSQEKVWEFCYRRPVGTFFRLLDFAVC